LPGLDHTREIFCKTGEGRQGNKAALTGSIPEYRKKKKDFGKNQKKGYIFRVKKEGGKARVLIYLSGGGKNERWGFGNNRVRNISRNKKRREEEALTVCGEKRPVFLRPGGKQKTLAYYPWFRETTDTRTILS